MNDPNTPPKRKTTVSVFAICKTSNCRRFLGKRYFSDVNSNEVSAWVCEVAGLLNRQFPLAFKYEVVSE